MKATTQSLTTAATSERSWFAVYADLFKARLTLLVLLTTLVGFYLASPSPVNYALMINTILGTALVVCGAAALNQLWERQFDAKMRRTQNRPLPAGRLQPSTVLRVGCGTALAGLIYLAVAVDLTVAILGAVSLVVYVFLYTPLKRVTWLNTAVGTVPGGLPVVMGWAAARGSITVESLALFGILAFWQIPHFMAIAWVYREEYRKAGFKMLPVLDPDGTLTGRQAVLNTVALLPVSLLPYFFGLVGPVYLVGAFLLGSGFLWSALRFSRHLDMPRAWHLFYLSIIYLPVLLILLVVDKVK